MAKPKGMPARQDDQPFEGIGGEEQDVESLEIAVTKMYLHGEESATAEEVAHHLRYSTGTISGAGKRIAGFRREPVLGELLDVDTDSVESLGGSVRETL
jgi:hypothetical protein